MAVENFGRIHIFAVCEGGNIYKIARFSEKELCDDYTVWSHIGHAHGIYQGETFYDEEYIEGDYVAPMDESCLQMWLQGHYCEDVNRMLELMTPMVGKICAFIYISTNKDIYPPYIIFRKITATEIYDVIPEIVDDIAIPQDNCEYFALSAFFPEDVISLCERERLVQWETRFGDNPEVVDRSYLQRLQIKSNYSKPVHATIVLTWFFDGDESFRLKQEPQYYLMKQAVEEYEQLSFCDYLKNDGLL